MGKKEKMDANSRSRVTPDKSSRKFSLYLMDS
ncbi:hypothetical protein HNY73_011187 [Argiope bruennichi]|uniref:Uncharacterized protein n=1 Tax=Argiope bruennichi TaxID=94029 RepID=A0A8T0F5I4_ARGBR|nr:hypothetical protein HNY73_011187 [Argiope bruennichi]